MDRHHTPADRPRLLMVSPALPRRGAPGLAGRACDWLTALQSSFAIHLACPVDRGASGTTADRRAIRPLVADLAVAPVQPLMQFGRRLRSTARRTHAHAQPALPTTLAQRIEQWRTAGAFDVGIAIGSGTAACVADAAIPHKLCDLSRVDDRDSIRQRRLQRWIVSSFDTVVVDSNRDAKLLATNGAEGLIRVARHGVGLSPSGWQPVNRTAMLAVCAIDRDDRLARHWLRWFTAEVWPRVEARSPDARLRVVLRQPPRPGSDGATGHAAWHHAAAAGSVDLVGPVPDPAHYMRDARLVLYPPQPASSGCASALDAMAGGRPVVTDAAILRQFEHEPGEPEPALAVDGVQGWSRAITDLLQRPDRAAQRGLAGRQYVQTHHDWHAQIEPIIAGLAGHRTVAKLRRRRATDVARAA